MTATFEEFQDKFQVARLTLWRSDHWVWSLRPMHCTLGASVLSLSRWCPQLGEMTAEEGAAFAAAARHAEARYAATFKPVKINYLKLGMTDAHLHFHVIPRYDAPQLFAGQHWSDTGWPAAPVITDGADLARAPVLDTIRDHLKGTE